MNVKYMKRHKFKKVSAMKLYTSYRGGALSQMPKAHDKNADAIIIKSHNHFSVLAC